MSACEPRGGPVAAFSRRGCRDQHLERQLSERTGGHDQQMLVADQLLHRTEQGFVESMGTGGIKRLQRVVLGDFVRCDAQETCALGCAVALPGISIKSAA